MLRFPPANFGEVCVSKQKNFLYIFLISRAQIFFKKEKKIFCFGVPIIRNGGKQIFLDFFFFISLAVLDPSPPIRGRQKGAPLTKFYKAALFVLN